MATPFNRRELYKQDPPPFGRELLTQCYALDPDFINLGNASYGTTPKPVLEAIDELSTEVELNPDFFHRRVYPQRLISVREQLATLIGANTNEVVLVSNTGMGVNTALRNFEWETGDQIFIFSTTFSAVTRAVKYLSDVLPTPSVSSVVINFPTTREAITLAFKDHVKAHPGLPNKKRVAIIDSIAANPGALLPWQDMVKVCREEGVWSVIDAAHSLGQEAVNMAALGENTPDFWVANTYKWLSCKRTVTVLYVPERNQRIIKTSIPTSFNYLSPGDPNFPNFVAQFSWSGTVDCGPYLTVADALEFRQWLGGEEVINRYCHNVALQGGNILANLWGTRLLDPTGIFTLNMVNVELPINGDPDKNSQIGPLFQTKLFNNKAFSTSFFHNGSWWTRCAVQLWNEPSDFVKISLIWLRVCEEVTQELGLPPWERKQ